MFSHLCRACLCDLNDSSDAVPLFEAHKNIVYNRLLHSTFRLSKEQKLSTNLCKKCAIEILQSYKFRLMYMESDRKLRKMLDKRADKSKDETIAYHNLVDVEVNIEEAETTAETSEGMWKCNKCSAIFKSRTLLREHKGFHRSNTVNYSRCTIQKPNENGQTPWKCDHCSCEFRTRQLKMLHNDAYHKNVSLTEPSVVINIDDDEELPNDFHFADISQVVDDPLGQNDFKYECSDSEMTTDLGLYLMEKHSQINSFDPLDANNSSGSLLSPMEVKEKHSKVKDSNIANEKWKCKICLEIFRTRDILREHKQLHRESKTSPKVEQVKHAKSSPKVEQVKHKKEHVVTVSEKKPIKNEAPKDSKLRWQCQTCSSAFDTRDNLRLHRRKHFVKRKSMDSNEWQCNICLAIFSKRRECVNHKRTEHENALSDEDMEEQPVVKKKKTKT